MKDVAYRADHDITADQNKADQKNHHRPGLMFNRDSHRKDQRANNQPGIVFQKRTRLLCGSLTIFRQNDLNLRFQTANQFTNGTDQGLAILPRLQIHCQQFG